MGGGNGNFTRLMGLVGSIAFTSGCCVESAARRDFAHGWLRRQAEEWVALTFLFETLEDLAVLGRVAAFLP